jgi:hypothetical protein
VTAGNTGGSELRTTADPTAVFFAASNPEDGPRRYSIYHALSERGPATPVVTNAGSFPFVASPSGTRVAHHGEELFADTIRVVTLSGSQVQSETKFTTTGIPGFKGFSPEEDKLVWGDGAGIHMASLSDGTVRLILPPPIDPGPLTHVMSPHVIWKGGDPHLLVAYPTQAEGGLLTGVYEVNGITGARTLLGELPLAVAAPRELARSADGRAFAAWVPIEPVGDNVERPAYRYQLLVQASPGGPVVKLLERTGDYGLSWLEFSPDGSRLGLDFSFSTYVVRVGVN